MTKRALWGCLACVFAWCLVYRLEAPVRKVLSQVSNSLLNGCVVTSTNQTSPSSISCAVPSGWTYYRSQGFESGSFGPGEYCRASTCVPITSTPGLPCHTGTHCWALPITGNGSDDTWGIGSPTKNWTDVYYSAWVYWQPVSHIDGGNLYIFRTFCAKCAVTNCTSTTFSCGQEFQMPNFDQFGNGQPVSITKASQGLTIDFVPQGVTTLPQFSVQGYNLPLGVYVQDEAWFHPNTCTGGVPNTDGFVQFFENGALVNQVLSKNLIGCPALSSLTNFEVGGQDNVQVAVNSSNVCVGSFVIPTGQQGVTNHPFASAWSKYPFEVDGTTPCLNQNNFNRVRDDIIILYKTSSSPGSVILSPSSLTFPSTGVGFSSPTQTVNINNNSGSTITFSTFSVTGTNSGDFSQTHAGCGATLATGASCPVVVTFTPTAVGTAPRTASLSVAYTGASGSPLVANLSGTVPSVSLTPASLAFGTVVVGQTSPAQTITLTNTGTGTLSISSITPTGSGGAGAFASIIQSPGATSTAATSVVSNQFNVPAGASYVFGVRHGTNTTTPFFCSDTAGNTINPSAAGLFGATGVGAAEIFFVQNAIAVTNDVISCGFGTPANPVSVAFNHILGAVYTGMAAAVADSSWGVGQTSVSNTCTSPTFSTANASDVLVAYCTPRGGSITQYTAGSGYTLRGNAVAFDGAIEDKFVSATQTNVTSTLAFNGAAVPYIYLGLNLKQGSQVQTFAQTHNCGTSLAPGGSCTINVTFSPSAAGAASGSVTVTDNASGSPHTTTLTGTGVTAVGQIALSPTSLTFAAQNIGTSSPSQAITVTNSGGAAASISTIAVSGGNSGDFTQTNNCPISPNTLAAAGTCTINVVFKPTAAGTRTSSVVVTDNTSGSPHSTSLSGSGIGTPGITFAPSALAFGNQVVGSASAALNLGVTNNGTASLSITSVTLGGTNPGDFTIASNNCVSSSPLAIGVGCNVSVTFTPGATGSRSATLNFADNAPASPQAVSLTGTGTQSGTQFSPTSVAFGNQTVNTTSAATSVQLTNNGTATLNISSIQIAGTNAADFSISANTCGATLAALANCNVSVTFTPSLVAAEAANLTFTDDAPGSPQTVALSGTGVSSDGQLSPSSANFGSVVVGQSAAQTFAFNNTGAGTMSSIVVSVTGTNAADFPQTNNCPSSLPPNSGCSITVTVTPSLVGAESATLNVADSGANSPQTAKLSVTGTQAAVTLSPTSLAFTQLAGGTSPGQAVTLTNSGTATLTGIAISITGTDSSLFAFSTTCTATLNAGANCSATVTFSPITAGSFSATLNFADNGPGSPQSVGLSGTGTTPGVISFNPTSLTFANQAVGTSSPAMQATMLNTGGSSVTITPPIAVQGANPGDFAESDNCGTALNANASCVINVIFTPTLSGARTANIAVTDNAAGSPQTVPLSGTGFVPAPGALLSATSLSFGNQATGTTSNPLTTSLSNNGTATLAITSIQITGANASDFGQTNNCGASLAVGKSCNISVTFAPALSSVGTRNATVTITDNAVSSPQSVALSGVGVASGVGAPAPGMFSRLEESDDRRFARLCVDLSCSSLVGSLRSVPFRVLLRGVECYRGHACTYGQ